VVGAAPSVAVVGASGLFLFLRLRIRRKMTPKAVAPITASAPTTPPTMAPTLVEDFTGAGEVDVLALLEVVVDALEELMTKRELLAEGV
jgi:hypothetical protein